MSHKINHTAGELATRMKTPCLQGSTNIMIARDVMEDHDVDIIGVACRSDFVGTFSRSDFKNLVIRQNLDPLSTTLYEVMHSDPPYILKELYLEDACKAMNECQWEHMPVLSGKKFIGIISLNDLSIIRDLMDIYKSSAYEKEAVTNCHRSEEYGLPQY